MSLDRAAAAASQLPLEGFPVAADMNYLEPPAEKPYNYTFDPPDGASRTNAVYAPYRVLIHDMRPIAGALSLDREGFALARHASAVGSFYDEDAVRRVYYPEAERLVGDATGGKRVIVFDHTIRRNLSAPEDRRFVAPRAPVTRVHNDYTERSGPQRVRDLMGAEADTLLDRRFAVVNVWRPIRGPLRDKPLAALDATTVARDDLISVDLVYPDRTGEIYYVRHNPAHRWYYAPAMEEDEALLLKCFDSARDGRARFSPHSAFVDPTTPEDALPRESIELRTLVFY